jgi:hypothetical protein
MDPAEETFRRPNQKLLDSTVVFDQNRRELPWSHSHNNGVRVWKSNTGGYSWHTWIEFGDKRHKNVNTGR